MTGLSTKTLWWAYKKSAGWRSHYREYRVGGGFRIALDTDEYALRWQRYDALTRRLEKLITDRLTGLGR